jgi:signal transduction histidine kinase
VVHTAIGRLRGVRVRLGALAVHQATGILADVVAFMAIAGSAHLAMAILTGSGPLHGAHAGDAYILSALVFASILFALRENRRPPATFRLALHRTTPLVAASAIIAAGTVLALYGAVEYTVLVVAICPALALASTVTHLAHKRHLASSQSEAIPTVSQSAGISSAELSAILSHEMRSPLSTLQAVSELAMEEDIAPHDRRRLLVMIQRQVQRLDTLTRDVVDAFRVQSEAMEIESAASDLGHVCAEMIQEYRLAAGGHWFELDASGGPITAAIDAPKLRIVLRNLIGNACKYAPRGTTVTVALATTGSEARVTVRDEGPGIAPEHLSRIFDQFYRVPGQRRKAEGYGLGLFITRALVERHGGRIWAHSEPGSGSSFTFTVPMRLAAGSASSRSRTPAPVSVA